MRRRIVDDDQAFGDAAQLRDAPLPLRRVHDHAQADGDVEAAIRKVERMRVADQKAHRRALVGGPAPCDRQHLARRVDRRDVGASARQQQRRAARAGADVENHAVADRSRSKSASTRAWVLGDELANRPAEPARVEGAGRFRIGVGGVAVVIALGRLTPTSFDGRLATGPAPPAPASAAQAWRVRSR